MMAGMNAGSTTPLLHVHLSYLTYLLPLPTHTSTYPSFQNVEMDVHPSISLQSKHLSQPRSQSNMQRRRTASHTSTNSRSIYTNPSPATSRADSPTTLRSHGFGVSYTGPYRMIPGKTKAHLPQCVYTGRGLRKNK